MKSYLRIISPGAQLLLFIGLLLCMLLLTSFVSIGILMSKGLVSINHPGLDLDNPKGTGTLKLVQGISTVTIFLLPALLFAFINFRFRHLFFLGFRKPGKFNYYILAIAIMLLSFPLVGWLGELNEHIPLAKWMIDTEKDADQQMQVFLKVNSSADVFVNLFIVALLPAICEEACFRGALQRIFIHVFKSPWTGIIVTAIFFSAFHMEFQGFLPRMFLGILLGALYWYSGSLWVSILAHFFNNGIQVIAVSYYPKYINENPSVPLYAALASALIVLGLLMIVRRQSNITYARVYELGEINADNAMTS
jgi:uncharacterized protein